jgi:DNA-binding GntR family transcriptional regulator
MKPEIEKIRLKIVKEYMRSQENDSARLNKKALHDVADKYCVSVFTVRKAIDQFTKTTRVLNIGE